jgi:hypothetical protein
MTQEYGDMGFSISHSFHVRPASKLNSTLLMLFGPPKAIPLNFCSTPRSV